MSITRQNTVWCDGCNDWEQRSYSVKHIRMELKQKGWITARVDGKVCDFCSKCSKERTKR